jgi:hypothetical protein
MLRAMANAPVLLRGYIELNRAMKRSHLDRRIRERISLAIHAPRSSVSWRSSC